MGIVTLTDFFRECCKLACITKKKSKTKPKKTTHKFASQLLDYLIFYFIFMSKRIFLCHNSEKYLWKVHHRETTFNFGKFINEMVSVVYWFVSRNNHSMSS